jgi:hypothetical protein
MDLPCEVKNVGEHLKQIFSLLARYLSDLLYLRVYLE